MNIGDRRQPYGGGPVRQHLGGTGPREPRQSETIDVSDQVAWIAGANGLATLGNKDLVVQAERLGQLFKAAQMTTQLRNLYDRVNALSIRLSRGFAPDQIPLLKVRLAYMAARGSGGLRDLVKVLLPAVGKIENEADFRWFARFVEAIVAFHRYHSDQEKQGRE